MAKYVQLVGDQFSLAEDDLMKAYILKLFGQWHDAHLQGFPK
jgi:hypothetical protein